MSPEEIAGAIGVVLGVIALLVKVFGFAAKVTRIHDAVSEHLPARIDGVEADVKAGRDEQRVEHAQVKAELADLKRTVDGLAFQPPSRSTP